MKNYIQEGVVLTVVATNLVKSGDLIHVGSICGIAACDGDPGKEVEVRCEGVFEVPKIAPADVLAAGSPVTNGVGKVGAAGANIVGGLSRIPLPVPLQIRLIPGTGRSPGLPPQKNREGKRDKSSPTSWRAAAGAWRQPGSLGKPDDCVARIRTGRIHHEMGSPKSW
jgi:predicted RecA/RadA family phage recombinase